MDAHRDEQFIIKRQSLISIAMLKVNYDQRQVDYVEYLAPFVYSALRGMENKAISTHAVSQRIREIASIVIPTDSVELFLKRLVKRKVLRREYNSFWIDSPLPSADDFASARQQAAGCIDTVMAALKNYVKAKFEYDWDDEAVLSALHAYLNRFGVECLDTFVRRSVLPDLHEKRAVQADFIINRFIQDLYLKQNGIWDAMYVLVRAHLSSNALLYPDLQSLEKSFSKLTAYLDTRVILRLLGLEGAEHLAATTELVDVLNKLAAKLAVFSHTLLEIDHVIEYCAKALRGPGGRGQVILHARRTDMRESDLLLIRAQVRPKLSKLNITTLATPSYTVKYQIDESTLGEWLEEEISGPLKEKVKDHDINCVRSIYALRQGSAPTRLEDAKAAFVTTNAALARSAYKYGKRIESSREVSPVVTTYSLGNIAWLKCPLDAMDLPRKEMLSMAFAAMPNRAKNCGRNFCKKLIV